MKRQQIMRLALAGLGAALCFQLAPRPFGAGDQAVFAQARGQRESRRTMEEGVEVLTRGPVHEAFAEPVLFEPGMNEVILTAPPDPIDELPPQQRPDGD